MPGRARTAKRDKPRKTAGKGSRAARPAASPRKRKTAPVEPGTAQLPPEELFQPGEPPPGELEEEGGAFGAIEAPGGAEREDLPEAEEKAEGKPPALYDPLASYFQSIRHYPILSREEEKVQAERYLKTQEIESAYQLVTGNLRLVVKIAMEYRRAWRDIMDLIGEGNVGLMQAVKKYDPYRGVRFSSYAAWWIRAYILRYIINNVRMVKLGTTQAQRTLFYQLGRERERLRRLGIEPDNRSLAASLSVKESEVDEMAQRLAGNDLSLEAPRGEGEDFTILDTLPGKEPDAESLVGEARARDLYLSHLAGFVAGLSEREKRIFKARWMRDDPKTLHEVGEELGLTRERVRQLEARILRNLRAYLEEKGLGAGDLLG